MNNVYNKSVNWKINYAFNNTMFRYPLQVNVSEIVQTVNENKLPSINKINEYAYHFVHSPRGICNGTRDIHVLFLIKSSMYNYRRRQAIRKTWGSISNNKALQFKYVFLLGCSQLKNKMEAFNNTSIKSESEYFNDILQMDFEDQYYNNTFKSRGALKWVYTNSSLYHMACSSTMTFMLHQA